jgi:hypothetical protein
LEFDKCKLNDVFIPHYYYNYWDDEAINSNITIRNSSIENNCYLLTYFDNTILENVHFKEIEGNFYARSITVKEISLKDCNLNFGECIEEMSFTDIFILNSDLEIRNCNNNLMISNVRANNSNFTFINCKRVFLKNSRFTNCSTALKVYNSSIKYESLSFHNNNLDLDLTGSISVNSFSNFSNINRLVNYRLTVYLLKSNGKIFSIPENSSLKVEIYNKTAIFYSPYPYKKYYRSTLEYERIPIYKENKNGSLVYYDPFTLKIDLKDINRIPTKTFIKVFDPKDINDDFNIEVYW